MTSTNGQAGFMLSELLVTLAIIGILSSVAIPGYVGFQNKSRRLTMERAAKSATYELQGWTNCARQLGDKANLTEVDTNYDGTVSVGSDMTNLELRTLGISQAYLDARNNPDNLHGRELSPFAGSGSLPSNLTLWAETSGSGANGQIDLVDNVVPGGVLYVAMSALDNMGRTIISERIPSE